MLMKMYLHEKTKKKEEEEAEGRGKKIEIYGAFFHSLFAALHLCKKGRNVLHALLLIKRDE